jgi:hypothetical protein
MRFVQFLSLQFAIIGSFGCVSDPVALQTASYWNPQIPGGKLTTSQSLDDVTNITAYGGTPGAITVTYQIPSIYLTEVYTVSLYRMGCDVKTDNTCTLPDPSIAFSGADFFKVASITGNSYTDTVSSGKIGSNQTYSYWAYINIGTRFSSGVSDSAATVQQVNQAVTLPANFWGHKTWSIGLGSTNYVALSSLAFGSLAGLPQLVPQASDPTYPSLSAFSSIPSIRNGFKGGIATALNGRVMYYADTDNNRVVIFTNQASLGCGAAPNPLTVAYKFCVESYSNAPMTATNIIGQPTAGSNSSCANRDPNLISSAECLTAPTDVFVDSNQRLVIVDSGNNRVVVWNHLPYKSGCDINAISGVSIVRDCTPDSIIGVPSQADAITGVLTSSDISTDYVSQFSALGDRTLNRPTYVTGDGTDLYISDTGNNRVVRVPQYTDPSYFSCVSGFSTSPICKFIAVLGQPNMFSNYRIATDSKANWSSVIDTAIGAHNLATSAYQGSFKRFISNPGRLVLAPGGQLLVSTFEGIYGQGLSLLGTDVELLGRILIFGTNPISGSAPACNQVSFFSGGCDASDVIGQTTTDAMPFYTSPSGSYSSNIVYGLNSVSDFFLDGTQLMVNVPIDLGGSTATNNQIYVYKNVLTSGWTGAGISPDYKIINPLGVPDSVTKASTPNVVGLSGMHYDADSSVIFISDVAAGRIYQVNKQNY